MCGGVPVSGGTCWPAKISSSDKMRHLLGVRRGGLRSPGGSDGFLVGVVVGVSSGQFTGSSGECLSVNFGSFSAPFSVS